MKLTVGFADASGNPIAGANTLSTTLKLNPEIVSITSATTTIHGGQTFSGAVTLFAPYTGSSTITVSTNKPGSASVAAPRNRPPVR